MNRDLAAEAIARLASDLDAPTSAVLVSSEPFDRPVDILLRSWEPWLRDGGRPGSASYVGPLEPSRVTAARAASRGLTMRDPGRRGADHEIDRPRLLELSVAAARGNERRCVTLWVAAMMWGSGTLNGRGPWRTAEGLAHPDLGTLLVESHRCVRNGDLSGAYTLAQDIPGSGEATFTKWLWAAGLAFDDPQQGALIFDGMVRSGLATLDIKPGRTGDGYADFVSVMHAAAERLRATGFEHVTAERLEWLLGSGVGRSIR